MNKREERTSHKQEQFGLLAFGLGFANGTCILFSKNWARSLGFSLRNARGMVNLTHEPTIRDSAFRFENIGLVRGRGFS